MMLAAICLDIPQRMRLSGISLWPCIYLYRYRDMVPQR